MHAAPHPSPILSNFIAHFIDFFNIFVFWSRLKMHFSRATKMHFGCDEWTKIGKQIANALTTFREYSNEKFLRSNSTMNFSSMRNLYGFVMMQHLPSGGFRRVTELRVHCWNCIFEQANLRYHFENHRSSQSQTTWQTVCVCIHIVTLFSTIRYIKHDNVTTQSVCCGTHR